MKTNASLGIITIISSFVLTYLLGILIIPILKKLKAAQTTKEMVKDATKENKNFDVKYFTTRQDLIDHIKKNAKLNDIMLFKASLGMNFKEIITNSFF